MADMAVWTWIVSRVDGLRKTPQGNGMRTARGHAPPSSFIRTMTVGPGIRPDLLTPGAGNSRTGALAGLSWQPVVMTGAGDLPPVGNRTPP